MSMGAFFVLLSVACSDDLKLSNYDAIETKGDAGSTGSSDTVMRSDSTLNGQIILGATIPNPYTLDTVRKAFSRIYPNGYGKTGPSNFVATHLYLRFLPTNDEEYELLEDRDIVMTTLPMHRSVVNGGSSYFDPALDPNVNEYTWQYTIIPVNQTIPNVRYEVLKQLCNLEPVTDGQQGPGGVPNSVLASIETKAYQMTGHSLPPSVSESDGLQGWRPSGTIRVWDDLSKQFIGAKGAKVVCKAFCFITQGYADSYGRYSTNSKRGSDWNVEYEIQWRSDEWKVQDNDEKKEAIYIGPKRNKSWSLDIQGGRQQMFATVTRALERMYNQYNENVMRPTGLFRIKVVCIDANGENYGDSSGSSFLGIDTKATINIWRFSRGSLRETQFVFGTTVHELAHAVHFRRMSTQSVYNNTDDIVAESWTRLVQNYITRLEYKELSQQYGITPTITFDKSMILAGQSTYGAVGKIPHFIPTTWNCQDWPYFNGVLEYGYQVGIVKKMLAYSPLFIDLVDDNNQGLFYKAFGVEYNWPATTYKRFLNDGVSGYTLAQIQGAVPGSKTLDEVRVKVKAIRNNSSENIKIDTLFNKVKYYWNKYK